MTSEMDEAKAAGTIGEYRAQAGIFTLLGRALEHEVDEAFLELLRTRLRAPLAEAGVELPDDMVNGQTAEVLEQLAVEFTGLFVAPGAISPYASVFETGAMAQEPSSRVNRWYTEAGFEFRRMLSGEFPDHVGTMLRFVAELYSAEADCWERGDDVAAGEIKVRRERFLLEELGGWVPGWCRIAASVAGHPFYERMLDLTGRVLWEELTLIAPPRRLRELSDLNARRPARLESSPEFRKASGL